MIPMIAYEPLHCVAIRNWSAYSIGSVVLDACGLAPHCMNQDRQYHLAKAPGNQREKGERKKTEKTKQNHSMKNVIKEFVWIEKTEIKQK